MLWTMPSYAHKRQKKREYKQHIPGRICHPDEIKKQRTALYYIEIHLTTFRYK